MSEQQKVYIYGLMLHNSLAHFTFERKPTEQELHDLYEYIAEHLGSTVEEVQKALFLYEILDEHGVGTGIPAQPEDLFEPVEIDLDMTQDEIFQELYRQADLEEAAELGQD